MSPLKMMKYLWLCPSLWGWGGGGIVFLEVYDAAPKNDSNRSDSGFLKFTPYPVAPSLLRRTCMSMCAHTRGNVYQNCSIYFMIQKWVILHSYNWWHIFKGSVHPQHTCFTTLWMESCLWCSKHWKITFSNQISAATRNRQYLFFHSDRGHCSMYDMCN